MTAGFLKSPLAIGIGVVATLGILGIIGYKYWGWFGGSTPKLNIVSADKKSIDFEWAIGEGGAEYSYVAGVSGNPERYDAKNGWSLSVSWDATNSKYIFKILKDGVQQSNAIEKDVTNNTGRYASVDSMTDCVKHIFQDSYRGVIYELHIWAKNCTAPNVPAAISFVDSFMNIHIQQGIVNTPQQIIDELMAEFKIKFPSLRLTITKK